MTDMSLIYFITHPEVIIDPNTPITQWSLSEEGWNRTQQLLNQPWIVTLQQIFSSEELKAHQTAEVIATHRDLFVYSHSKLGEIDRSSTGYLIKKEFDKTVKEFFAQPENEISGWESAVNAQKRIVKEVKTLIATHPNQNLAIVSHGGVGALLICWLKKVGIHQRYDQKGLGSYFVFDSEELSIVREWRPIDQIESAPDLL